jgi:hypothetical protein
VFNYVNLHVYHYAGNNPVKYTDPDGEILQAVIIKLAKDAAIGAAKGAAVAVGMKYLTTSIIRFMYGESFSTAFTPRRDDLAEYGKTALKGAGSGAVSGLLSNIPGLGKLANSGRIGSGLTTAAVNMMSTIITTIANNIIEGKDITEGLIDNVTISGIIGFAVGFISPQGMFKKDVTGFNPITGAPFINNEGVYLPTEAAIRAKLWDIIGSSLEEFFKGLQ